jgi:hypothetical protein
MRGVGHVAFICERICWRNPREKDHLGDPGIDGKVILKTHFRK